MKMSRIGSKNTYYKSLRQLHQSGYIIQHISSKISIIHLDKKEEKDLQQLDLFNPENEAANTTNLSDSMCPKSGTDYPHSSENACPKCGTETVPHLSRDCPKNGTKTVPHLGHLIKHINSKHINEENSHAKNCEENSEEEKINGLPRVPLLGHVESFFQQNNYPVTEAQKFFHHYQSNGWLIAGKTKMKDWQASAHKWMLNVKDFMPPNIHDLDNNKDYSQPL